MMAISIKVKFIGPQDNVALNMDLPEGSAVIDVYHAFWNQAMTNPGFPESARRLLFASAESFVRATAVTVNKTMISGEKDLRSTVVKPGDEIVFIPHLIAG